MADGSAYASGRPFTCYTIRPGDTARSLAQRLTGSPYDLRQPWFQILDPATATFVSKSRYNIIQSGWHVCVATDVLKSRSTPAYFAAESPAPVALPQTHTSQNVPIDLSFLLWAAPLVAVVSGLVTARAWKYMGQRRVLLDIMRAFAERFVAEFERPLFRSAASSPVRSRLRFAPARHRLEILLAPADGRTYPNLLDHKRNVEYDVGRVLRLLRDEPFINGPLYAEGPWVVIPCRVATDRGQESVP